LINPHGFWNRAAYAAVILTLGLAAPSVRAAEATFERTLNVSGKADLTVTTGSGAIHLTRGAAGVIHVVGHVRSGWGGSEERVKQIAAQPPIRQTGSIVRIGFEHENLRNISIDYDVQAPEGVILNASTGSGEVNDDGVGVGARLSTGSGSIHATALKGGFTAETGSGNISIEAASAGDAKAETGSGSIDLHHLNGALKAETGSGSIKVEGVPTNAWKIGTGSGSVELWASGSSYDLDAESGSGSIHADPTVASSGNDGEHHHLRGKVGSGGPLVKVETGSGSIRIH